MARSTMPFAGRKPLSIMLAEDIGKPWGRLPACPAIHEVRRLLPAHRRPILCRIGAAWRLILAARLARSQFWAGGTGVSGTRPEGLWKGALRKSLLVVGFA